MELLTNMSDCEDESTSESENEGDSSDSSEDAPEQHQVRTDSNILMLKETELSKAKKYPTRAKKLHQNWLIIRVPQSMLYWLIKQPQHQVLHLQKYLKYLKPKKYPKRAKKLHQNWLIIRVPQSMLYWLIKQPQHQVLHLQKYLKYLKPKKYPKKGKKAAPKLVDNQSATKAMASDSDIEVEDYYVIEDANESDSSKYVPCINYANDKV